MRAAAEPPPFDGMPLQPPLPPGCRCATCHFEYGQHECCGHFLRGSDAPESKGCKQCGLCWPEHQACPKFATSGGHDGAAPETGDGAAGHAWLGVAARRGVKKVPKGQASLALVGMILPD